ncbi:hypothetical protein NEDG_00411 [Nematocida displodere]|uniref:SHSP domain-containing protein n=1 Tax=Nematocida displodere TaxID=1805483 RepID=A0A177EJR7_9MICR|nr:hypothetical protein NEDG_00411 [Nematocida displodere]
MDSTCKNEQPRATGGQGCAKNGQRPCNKCTMECKDCDKCAGGCKDCSKCVSACKACDKCKDQVKACGCAKDGQRPCDKCAKECKACDKCAKECKACDKCAKECKACDKCVRACQACGCTKNGQKPCNKCQDHQKACAKCQDHQSACTETQVDQKVCNSFPCMGISGCLEEKNGGYKLTLPEGISKEDVNITAHGDTLTLSYKKEQKTKDEYLGCAESLSLLLGEKRGIKTAKLKGRTLSLETEETTTRAQGPIDIELEQ